MRGEQFPAGDELWGFLLVFARVSAVLVFIPIAGWRRSPDAARVVFSVALAMALNPVWPTGAKPSGLGELIGWVVPEIVVGLVIGVATGLLIESFLIAAQIIGMQAGYSYASTIDPSSEADSSVLQVIAQLTAGLLFFSFRIDAELVRALAMSYDRYPAGTFAEHWSRIDGLLRLGTEMWKTGLRVALPVVFLLMMLDLALALLGRIQAQLQLLTLAFPAKMLTSLAMLAAMAGVLPYAFREQADRLLAWLR